MYFRTLTILHTALLAGQLFFVAIIYFVYRSRGYGSLNYPGRGDLYFYIAFAVVFATALASYYLYQSKVEQAKGKPTLGAILADYQGAMLIRDACLEGTSLLCTIAFFITGNERYLALTGMIILIFLIWWPTRHKVIADLALEGDFRSRLEEPDAVVD